MDTAIATNETISVITADELLQHWQGHRRLTRKLIEAFPEKEFFEYSIGGMRPFAAMVQELLAIGVPGIREIVAGNTEKLNENINGATTKANVLALWDKATEELNQYWRKLPTRGSMTISLHSGSMKERYGLQSFTSSTTKFITGHRVLYFCVRSAYNLPSFGSGS